MDYPKVDEISLKAVLADMIVEIASNSLSAVFFIVLPVC